tara:strand:- start:291 stop:461 length:171 start_codon:yes stop_codon:yes gene_type:complete
MPKGSWHRPYNKKEWNDKYDKIFGDKKTPTCENVEGKKTKYITAYKDGKISIFKIK